MYTRAGPYLAGMGVALVVGAAEEPREEPPRVNSARRRLRFTGMLYFAAVFCATLFLATQGADFPLRASDPNRTVLRNGPIWWWLEEGQKQRYNRALYVFSQAFFGLGAALLLLEMLSGRAERLRAFFACSLWVPLARLSYVAYLHVTMSRPTPAVAALFTTCDALSMLATSLTRRFAVHPTSAVPPQHSIHVFGQRVSA